MADRLRIGIVGCGDVAHRRYLPALASRSDRVSVAAFADPTSGAAEAAAAAAEAWSPGARIYGDAGEMLTAERLDGVINLTPAPVHGRVNRAILAHGVACYSEKPLAASVPEADALIDLARSSNVAFLCAPGSAATSRVRWLRDLAGTGPLGRPTLVVAHYADAGPADWLEYTGDPRPFYQPGVGPVFDHGVYRLHEITTVLGPVRRVQAMGTIAKPLRSIRGGPLRGQTFDVGTYDHVLVHLEFASGVLGQLLASYGTVATLAPWLELHLEHGVASFRGEPWDPNAPVTVFTETDPAAPADAGLGAWAGDVEIPRDPFGAVEIGALHFIAVLLDEEEPVLTAEHARHILDIVLKAYASIEDGASHETETTF